MRQSGHDRHQGRQRAYPRTRPDPVGNLHNPWQAGLEAHGVPRQRQRDPGAGHCQGGNPSTGPRPPPPHGDGHRRQYRETGLGLPATAPAAVYADDPHELQSHRLVEPEDRPGLRVEPCRGADEEDRRGAGGQRYTAQILAGESPWNSIVPTTVTVNPAGVALRQIEVEYPASRPLPFPSLAETLAVWDGKVDVVSRLAAEEDASAAQGVLRAAVRYQACDDELCLLPVEVVGTIPVSIGD